MSYARWGPDSDVYVYQTTPEGGRTVWLCCSCSLLDIEHSFTAGTRAEMIAHLQDHELRGHKVPSDARERLLSEIVNPPCAYWVDVPATGPKPPRCGKCSYCRRFRPRSPNG